MLKHHVRWSERDHLVANREISKLQASVWVVTLTRAPSVWVWVSPPVGIVIPEGQDCGL